MPEPFSQLAAVLESLPAGDVQDYAVIRDIEGLLAAVWGGLRGGREEGMAGYKLINRTEDMRWEAPELSFKLERHGGTVRGSTRAEVHQWIVNVKERTATIVVRKRRQVAPTAPRLNIRPIVDQMVEVVHAAKKHDWVTWKDPGKHFVLRIGKVIPGEGAFAQTVSSRRKRFIKALEEILVPLGWENQHAGSHYVYKLKELPAPPVVADLG